MQASKKQVGGSHYKDFAIQPAEFAHKNKLGFLEGNVIKYTCRHAAKNGKQDLEKALHYLELLMEWEYGDDTRRPGKRRGEKSHDDGRRNPTRVQTHARPKRHGRAGA